MTFADALSHPFWQAWAETLLHFLWQGALLGLLAAILLHRRLLRTASQRYAVSLATLLLMAACVPMTFAIVAPLVVARNAVSPMGSGATSAAMRGIDESTTAGSDFSLFAGLTGAPEAVFRWVIVAWLIGFVVLSLRIFASWIGMRLLARGRQPIPASIANTIAMLSTRLGIRRVPLVFASVRVVDATVVGFLKPIVLLPAAWLVDLSPDMLEAVLAHELAHIRRHDLWINLAQRVVETVLFYHPAVWWVSRRLRAEREMCCDELAVSVTHQRLVYVTTLESVARRRAGLKPALAVTLGDQDMALLKRIQHILGFSAAPNGGWWPAALVALALPAALWFGWTSLVPGGTAVADEAAAKKEASETPPAKAEAEKKEERPAPSEARPEDERVPPPRERRDRGPDRERRRPPEGPFPGERGGDEGPHDNDRRQDAAGDDDRPRPGAMGAGSASATGGGSISSDRPQPGAMGASGMRGRRGGMSGGRGPRPEEGFYDDRPAFGGRAGSGLMPRRPGATGLAGGQAGRPDDDEDRPARSGQLMFGVGPAAPGFGTGLQNGEPRGRVVDDEDPDAPQPRQGSQDEMVRLLRDLHREVEQLRREVRELRDDRHPAPRGARGADRRRPTSDEDRDEALPGRDDSDGVDEAGNPVRFYREDRDGNLRRAREQGPRNARPPRKERIPEERPRGGALAPSDERRPENPGRRPEDNSRVPIPNDAPLESPRTGNPATPEADRDSNT